MKIQGLEDKIFSLRWKSEAVTNYESGDGGGSNDGKSSMACLLLVFAGHKVTNSQKLFSITYRLRQHY